MRKLFLLIALVALAPSTLADVFKWVDGNGSVHYGDTPPTNAREELVDLCFAGTGAAAEEAPCCAVKGQLPKQAELPVYLVVAAQPVVRDTASRGLDFGVFIMLRHGMTG